MGYSRKNKRAVRYVFKQLSSVVEVKYNSITVKPHRWKLYIVGNRGQEMMPSMVLPGIA